MLVIQPSDRDSSPNSPTSYVTGAYASYLPHL
jgi:hypothetical protein